MKIRTDNSLQHLHWWGLVHFPYFVHLVNHNEKSGLQITVHRTGEHIAIPFMPGLFRGWSTRSGGETGHVICGTQYKMKLQGSLLEMEGFPNGGRRAQAVSKSGQVRRGVCVGPSRLLLFCTDFCVTFTLTFWVFSFSLVIWILKTIQKEGYEVFILFVFTF